MQQNTPAQPQPPKNATQSQVGSTVPPQSSASADVIKGGQAQRQQKAAMGVDEALRTLQPAGDVSVISSTPQQATVQPPDNVAEVVASQLPAVSEDTLHVNTPDAASANDEIYIDLRGQLHHKNEEPNNTPS